jgi:hypothetical protein
MQVYRSERTSEDVTGYKIKREISNVTIDWYSFLIFLKFE